MKIVKTIITIERHREIVICEVRSGEKRESTPQPHSHSAGHGLTDSQAPVTDVPPVDEAQAAELTP